MFFVLVFFRGFFVWVVLFQYSLFFVGFLGGGGLLLLVRFCFLKILCRSLCVDQRQTDCLG